ncbi:MULTISPECIES: spondin domain-containing protein [Shewanella]|uniref:spondin domain-containing protein n=1 Tax=Shewanella TaxID=22 RepID=UPI0004B4AB91|nr:MULTISPECIES: spondin domain-containing protein [Shewanella]
MMISNLNRGPLKLLLCAGILAAVSGCSDNDNPAPTPDPAPAPTPAPVVEHTYAVTVTNLTANQPLSPVAVLATGSDYFAWQTGEMASLALETLAESGDSSAYADMEAVTMLATGTGVIMPGMSETINITLAEADVDSLSVLSMLVNTNDAFTGLNRYSIAGLALDESVSMTANAYDAGTEANSEFKGTIPGPADSGEGFNAERDDVDYVYIHPGVISADDGLADSVLDASHRFDNPVVSISISRTE